MVNVYTASATLKIKADMIYLIQKQVCDVVRRFRYHLLHYFLLNNSAELFSFTTEKSQYE